MLDGRRGRSNLPAEQETHGAPAPWRPGATQAPRIRIRVKLRGRRTACQRKRLLDVEAQFGLAAGMGWRPGVSQAGTALPGRTASRAESEDPALSLALSVRPCTYWSPCSVPLCPVLGIRS